ncbi:MAG: protease HtpX [Bdellovibrio sp.]|nr:MAG: protease HtpX [Bdellovibrio sp.]
MTWLKRIGFFLVVNILVITTISIFLNVVLPLFGIRLDPSSMTGLLGFCFVWGFGGAFISLLLSKWMAKSMMGVQIIDTATAGPEARNLVAAVHELARKAGLSKMPEVGVYESPELNAFATGPSRSNSLVAVSSGLLNSMNGAEIEGVLGHEVAHIANGDMVTMTLIQGVVNSFVLFFSRIISRLIASSVDEKYSYMVQYLLTILFDIAFSLLGSIVVAYFSRIREYRADQGGARYAGREKMIAGLRHLQRTFDRLEPDDSSVATLKISSKPAGVMALFSTHPPLQERIERLQKMA